MKTIFVGYVRKDSCDLMTKRERSSIKRYSFNTEAKLNVGDALQIDDYDTPVVVLEVLDHCFRYVNTNTGELSTDRQNSTLCYPIRTIEERQPSGDVLYFDKLVP